MNHNANYCHLWPWLLVCRHRKFASYAENDDLKQILMSVRRAVDEIDEPEQASHKVLRSQH